MKRMSASFLLSAVTLTFGYVHAQIVAPESLQVPKTAKFDTRYNSTDPKIVVFDDGQQTYVALPKEMTNPIVMSTVPSGEMLLQPTQMSPYLLLPGIHKKLKFLWGNARDVFVVHTGSSGVERNGAAAAFGAVSPLAVHGAVARPEIVEAKKQAAKPADVPMSEAPMAGQALERTAVTSARDNTSAVIPVVIGAEKVASAATAPIQTSMFIGSGETGTMGTPTATPEPASATTPVPAIERLTIQAGQRLSVALGAWLKSQSIELSWEPAGTLPGRVRDIVIDSTWLASQTALEPTLSEVLAPFGLTAHVLRQRQTTDASNVTILDTSPTSVVVRNVSNARP